MLMIHYREADHAELGVSLEKYQLPHDIYAYIPRPI